LAYRAATGQQLWVDRYNARLGISVPRIAVTPGGQTVFVTGGINNGSVGYLLASYDASTGRTRWTTRAPVIAGLAVNLHGKMVLVGGGRIAAYSLADGTVLWTTSYSGALPVAIALSRDGTRLFETGWARGGIKTVAYRT
jgi:outer membrane protein assembly factor BamB